MGTRQLTAIIEREGDGYVALCPELDIASQGYRIVVNCNKFGGQEVDHLHVHLLGGTCLAADEKKQRKADNNSSKSAPVAQGFRFIRVI